jgi:hypothetical protein
MDPLTQASRAELIAELNQRHRDLLKPGERIEIRTEEMAAGVKGRLTVSGAADGSQIEMEVRLDFKRAGLSGDEALGLVLDALDLSLGEFLEAGRSEHLPAAFEQRDLHGRTVTFRGRVRKPSLEAEADRLLGESSADEWD